MAYYQWYSGRKYSDIFKAISIKEFEEMYYTLHEADITKFVEIVDKKIKLCFPETNLKRIRTIYGCTQKELAENSGVSLRSIQMYEQRNKDINKASLDTVYSLSRVLGCKMEDLIELILELALEGGLEVTKNDKVPKYIRYIIKSNISL